MDYYVVECRCKNTPYLSETFIVKSGSKDMAIDAVMEQRINEINVQHQESNKEYENLGNNDILFPIFTKDDLIVLTLDEYMQKYGKNNTLDIGGD